MWQPSTFIEKKFNAETHRLTGETKLHEFADFVEQFTHLTRSNQRNFNNSLNTTWKPIILDEQPYESVPVLYLAQSDNKTLSRILSTLGGMCQEIENLKYEAESLYIPFLFYGEESGKSLDHLKSICAIIEPLQKIQLFVTRAEDVIVISLRQLNGILEKGYYSSNTFPSFSEIILLLGDLFICLLKFDTVLDQQVLKDHWLLYRRSLRNYLRHNSNFNFELDELRLFDKTLSILECSLLAGAIVKDLMENCLRTNVVADIQKNGLNMEFQNVLYSIISELEKNCDFILQKERWLQLNVLAASYFNIFSFTDKKLIKKLLELNRKISVCTLIGNIPFYPEHFLLKHVPSIAKHLDEKSFEAYRLNYINSKSQNLSKETNLLCLQACCFLVELEQKTKVNTTTLKIRHLQEFNILLFNGLALVKQINWTIKWIMNVHVDKMLPVTTTVLTCVSRLVETLKLLHGAFNKNILLICHIGLLISQQLQHKALSILAVLKKHHTQEKSYKIQQLDILSALNVCENAFKGPHTKWRLLIASLALSASRLNLSSLEEIQQIISKIAVILKFTEILRDLSDCSVLYWHYSYILPIYFSKLLAAKSNLVKYYSVLSALTDCEIVLGQKVTASVNKILSEKFYWSVNQTVETNLRLQTHLHLQLPPSDPFANFMSLNFKKFLPAPLTGTYKNLANETEHYLSMMFYNLTTVVLHDWKTYGEMRRLAALQYGLQTVDDDLPMQTLDQGLDVLEIMRNINVFVQKYLYNLNTQIFIEESSKTKQVNSINISHVANSIRTHGTGIMNTTVNYTYQFLKNKFRVFSQFLFDEQIKSKLLKDLRYFTEHKNEFNQMYPYERAEKFNASIKKLGTPGGESYLDLFRKVITHIGNAMGYVRLIRSGGNRCLAESACFIPNLTQVEHLKEIMKQAHLSPMSRRATDCLLKGLENVIDSFDNTTEYFQLLVKGFEPHFRNPKNMHLRNFYIIVPPLTINFIEHSLTYKERLFKKNKGNGAFTDDGFALGLAYVIELLDQESQLNSLHWFESVQKKFSNDHQKIKEQGAVSTNEDTKLKQTLTLTEKKISSFRREFKLLEYSFSSARLFFQ